MYMAMKRGVLALLMVAVLWPISVAPAEAAVEALFADFGTLLAEEPDMDIEHVFTGVFAFPEGEASMSVSARTRYTHDPLAHCTDISYQLFSSADRAMMTSMLYQGDYVIYGWKEEAGSKRIKRKVTEEALRDMIKTPPLLLGVAQMLQAYSDTAEVVEQGAKDSDEMTVRLWVDPQAIVGLLEEGELALGSIVTTIDTEAPLEVLCTFHVDTGVLSGIHIAYPAIHTYEGNQTGGGIRLDIVIYEIGQVSPIEMPAEAEDVPFS